MSISDSTGLPVPPPCHLSVVAGGRNDRGECSRVRVTFVKTRRLQDLKLTCSMRGQNHPGTSHGPDGDHGFDARTGRCRRRRFTSEGSRRPREVTWRWETVVAARDTAYGDGGSTHRFNVVPRPSSRLCTQAFAQPGRTDSRFRRVDAT